MVGADTRGGAATRARIRGLNRTAPESRERLDAEAHLSSLAGVTRRHRGLEQFAVLIDGGHEAACDRPKVLTRDAFGVGERRAECV